MSVLQSASSAITPFFSSLASGDDGSTTNSTSTSSNEEQKQLFVNEACLEFLIMEMVDLMFRTTTDSENDKEAVFYKLEMLGYQVGQSLVERDRPRFVDTLDVVKYICKDLWGIIFKKQIDNLKTNHRGVYVLQDNSFRWFFRMSTEAGSADAAKRAISYLWFPCGLIRGALANLGVVSTFQIKIAK
ncbi:7778_t:CDS:2 [Entrophospora sp. SA101]|nr:2607_t:CDS:2 [Entrophospora sp. SA101]CAJ0749903.1 7778_t:CDS:2 [Entrophospora sp. SA101]CAJ0825180.1 19478_t:CDS:2 [Entrophospora sp. SA101]CAJ0846197.1 9391_t:CDS:2 [Entrophospora sp. SA101]